VGHALATFQRKIEGLNLFDPAAAAAWRCMIVQIPFLKHF
jgi:hypothetical protein